MLWSVGLLLYFSRADSNISAHNSNIDGRYSSPGGIHFDSKNESVSLDDKMMAEDLPAEDAPNTLKSKTKQTVESTFYARGDNVGQHKPATNRPQIRSHGVQQQQQQQGYHYQPQVRSSSPEVIYECPDRD